MDNKNRQEQNYPTKQVPDNFLAEMVEKGLNKEFIDNADSFGKTLVDNKLTTSQIRRIFGHVKKIEGYKDPKKFLPQLIMLKPLLAYQAKRHSKVKPLKDVLTKGIDTVIAETDEEKLLQKFRLFCMGFEAILAYHRAYGGN